MSELMSFLVSFGVDTGLVFHAVCACELVPHSWLPLPKFHRGLLPKLSVRA
jgi:hypothetical protein